MSDIKLLHGDCLDKLKEMPNNSVDSICCDPPYGISFMGKKWDYDVPSVEVWQEVLRALKPGGHALVACGTRTQHRMAVNLEDAGFEIRDIVAWVYGSGFPKSLNIGKAVDKLQGNEREVVREYETHDVKKGGLTVTETKGNSPWEGWGTALKPAMELWTLCRKPLEQKTVAENVLKYSTGGLNIDQSRIPTSEEITNHSRSAESAISKGKYGDSSAQETHQTDGQALGRFPADFVHDGSDEVVSLFPNDTQRFFYSAKASKSERNKGLEGFEEKETRGGGGRVKDGYKEGEEELRQAASAYGAVKAKGANTHPTVKPIALMRYLCKLITPPDGIVLDPFMGSGSTGIEAKLEGFNFIGIEREEEYLKIAEARIEAWQPELKQETLV